MTLLLIALAIIVVLLILRKPYLGIVFTAASLPATDVLPQIPLASSVVPLIGAVTLGAFLLSRKRQSGGSRLGFTSVHLLGLLFIGWLYISNPQAAWLGRDRNWTVTFLQLWFLVWLAGELLDSAPKQHVLMWAFAIVTVISAMIALQQGTLGKEFDPTLRAAGLAQGANTAARYFVVAFVFLNYLRTISSNRLLRILSIGGMIAAFLGVFITGSRTGMLLLLMALGLLVLLQSQLRYRVQFAVLFTGLLLLLWFVSDEVFTILASITPSITQGTDTVGLRYSLWKAGWRMWQDHPIAGVGIGMYRFELPKYAQDLMARRYWDAVTHNTYVQLLAETGVVGLGIFLVMLVKSLHNFWSVKNIGNRDSEIALRNVWIVVFLVMIASGISKSDQADKLLWLTIGVSLYFQRGVVPKEAEIFVPQVAHKARI
jgi:O-antigen ligase